MKKEKAPRQKQTTNTELMNNPMKKATQYIQKRDKNAEK